MSRRRANMGEAIEFLLAHVGHTGSCCVEWPFARSGNYGVVHKSGSDQMVYAHRYICELVHGAAPGSSFDAAHFCNNPICINPTHLRWATRMENAADRIRSGTSPLGTKNPKAVLTEQLVHQIRALRGQKKRKEVASMFGVSLMTIKDIQLGKTWRHL